MPGEYADAAEVRMQTMVKIVPRRRILRLALAATALPLVGRWLSVTLARAGGLPPMVGAAVVSFGVSNWGAAPSAGFIRIGVGFAKGHVPAGSSPQIRRGTTVIDANFDDRSTWSDGSLKSVVVSMRDAAFPAGAARTYGVFAAPAAPVHDPFPKTVADITAKHAFAVKLSHVTETGGVIGRDANGTVVNVPALPPVPVGSGTFEANFATHMAVPTRIEKAHSGPVCDGWTGWGLFGTDPHLKANWHVDVWKNVDGSIYAIEIAAVVAQDWWSVPNAKLRSYDAVFVDGGTTLARFPTIVHPYASQWMTCVNDLSPQRGRRPWIGGAMPTLIYTRDNAYLIKAGLLEPIDLTIPPPDVHGMAITPYVPCGAALHNANVNQTGGSGGRGLHPVFDYLAMLSPTPETVAEARINALAGLAVPLHFRSNNHRTRPGEAADIANTVIALDLRGPGPAFDFTVKGMPAPVDAYADYRGQIKYQDGFPFPQGGQGVWVAGGDSSHAPLYSGFMWNYEGERWALEATLDHATAGAHIQVPNGYGGLAQVASTPNTSIFLPTVYGGIAGVSGQSQERSVAWSMNIIANAAAFVPDNHVAAGYIKRFAQQQSIFLRDELKQTPKDLQAIGAMFNDESGEEALQSHVWAPWQTNFTVAGLLRFAALLEDFDMRDRAFVQGNMTVALVTQATHLTNAYRIAAKQKHAGWAPDNLYETKIWTYMTVATSLVGATGTFTCVDGLYWYPVNGDMLRTSAFDAPAETPDATILHVVNSTAKVPQVRGTPTFKLSRTAGGAPLTFAANSASVNFDMASTAWNYPVANNSPQVHTDDFAPICLMAIVMLHMAGKPEATMALVDKQMKFLSTVIPFASNRQRAWVMRVPS